MRDYKTAIGSTPQDLRTEVMKFVAAGWQVQGGGYAAPIASFNGDQLGIGATGFALTFYQAMILP